MRSRDTAHSHTLWTRIRSCEFAEMEFCKDLFAGRFTAVLLPPLICVGEWFYALWLMLYNCMAWVTPRLASSAVAGLSRTAVQYPVCGTHRPHVGRVPRQGTSGHTSS